jgi:hypothetical protein
MLVFDNRLVNKQDGSTVLLQSHLLLELVDNWFIKCTCETTVNLLLDISM